MEGKYSLSGEIHVLNMKECLVSGTRGWVPLPCLQVLGYHEGPYMQVALCPKEKARKTLYLEYKTVLGMQRALLNILPVGLNTIKV